MRSNSELPIDTMAGQVEITVYPGGSSVNKWSWQSTMCMGMRYPIGSGEEKTRTTALLRAKIATRRFCKEIEVGLLEIH